MKELGKTDFSSVKNFIINLLLENNIYTYVSYYPGEFIEEFDYSLAVFYFVIVR